MNRLLPKSLFGQTLLILLAGLIVSHVFGSWIYTADREQAVRAVGGFAAAQRIANLTRLVQEAPQEWRERIVTALSDQTFRVSLSSEPPSIEPANDDTPVAQAIREFLIDQLSLGSERQPRVSASLPDSPMFGGWHPMMGRGPMMHGFGAFGMFGGFRNLAGRGPLAGWPMALLRNHSSRERPVVLTPVPLVHGDHGDHHSRRVRVGRAACDGATCLALGRSRAAWQRLECSSDARDRHD